MGYNHTQLIYRPQSHRFQSHFDRERLDTLQSLITNDPITPNSTEIFEREWQRIKLEMIEFDSLRILAEFC